MSPKTGTLVESSTDYGRTWHFMARDVDKHDYEFGEIWDSSKVGDKQTRPIWYRYMPMDPMLYAIVEAKTKCSS